MAYSDLLQTIAEVAVAFVGFAGLASIFGSRFSHDAPAVQEERLRGMIQSGLTAVSYALIPFGAEALGLSETSTWRVSSALLAATVAIISVAMTRRSAEAGVNLGPHPILAIVVLTLTTLLVGCLLVNAFGFFGDAAGRVYILGLLATLATTGMFFSRLLSSLSLARAE